ncbi:MAG TPA: DUF3108 domain-containing protein [Pyrinomonadaceae bacterium]|nr:DUF3108 domain-containing protein [Pyrinomonadaceae bacterium]
MSFLIRHAFLVLVAFAAVSFAQPAPEKLPYAVGEKLDYEVKLSKIISIGGVADMSLEVAKDEASGNLILKGRGVSKGSLLKLFRFSFTQEYDTLFDPRTGRTLKTTKHDVQKERVRDSIADFDWQEMRVTFVETDPKNPTRPPRRIASKMEEGTYDLASGLYYLRSQPMAIGKQYEIKISDSGLVYNVPVYITAREQQKTVLGKVWCWRVEPVVFGTGRLIEQKGSMIIWFTDDERKIPVRSRINSQIGKVDIKLKSATK